MLHELITQLPAVTKEIVVLLVKNSLCGFGFDIKMI